MKINNIVLPAILAIILCLVVGCQGSNCLSVGGAYKDFQGSLEYCFDKQKSSEASRPILTNSATGQVAVILTEDDIDKIEAVVNRNPSTKSFEDVKDKIKNKVNNILHAIMPVKK